MLDPRKNQKPLVSMDDQPSSRSMALPGSMRDQIQISADFDEGLDQLFKTLSNGSSTFDVFH